MKQKAPTIKGINSFLKPISSTSTSNITGVENVNPYEEEPIANNNIADQEVVASMEVAEQCRIGSTTYESDPVSSNKFGNSLRTSTTLLYSGRYLSTLPQRISIHYHFIFWRAIVQTAANMVVQATKA